MKYTFITGILFFCFLQGTAQNNPWTDSLRAFRERYIQHHEVIKDKKERLRFFAPDSSFRVKVTTERIWDAPWFAMETSGKVKKVFRAWAIVRFEMEGKKMKLTVYQSQQLMRVKEYEDYLFLPFTDLTNGESTYENGRYLDLRTGELEAFEVFLDFNKAYNPYCAYISDVYNCPLPPASNRLPVAVSAGEMKPLH